MRVEELPPVKATVVVNGQPLEEHVNEDDGTPNIRYVEATSGSEFCVCLTFHSSVFRDRSKEDVLNCSLSLDGHHIISKMAELGYFVGDKFAMQLSGSYNFTAGTLSRFKFADLATSEESAAEISSATYKQLGEIVIVLRWAVVKESQVQVPPAWQQTMVGVVPEKCLKGRALSRVTSRSEPIRTVLPGRVDLEWRYGRSPVATYVFKYRSRRDLQIEGVIPREPSLEPLQERNQNRHDPTEDVEETNHLAAVNETKQASSKTAKRNFAVIIDDDGDDAASASNGSGQSSSYKRR